MKTHRQYKKSSRIGEVSSKYGYEPDKLDLDIKDKIDKKEKLTNDAFEMLDKMMQLKIKYIDDSVMSYEVKYKAIIEALKKVNEKYEVL